MPHDDTRHEFDESYPSSLPNYLSSIFPVLKWSLFIRWNDPPVLLNLQMRVRSRGTLLTYFLQWLARALDHALYFFRNRLRNSSTAYILWFSSNWFTDVLNKTDRPIFSKKYCGHATIMSFAVAWPPRLRDRR